MKFTAGRVTPPDGLAAVTEVHIVRRISNMYINYMNNMFLSRAPNRTSSTYTQRHTPEQRGLLRETYKCDTCFTTLMRTKNP